MLPFGSRICLVVLAGASCAHTPSAPPPAPEPKPSPVPATTAQPTASPAPSVFRAPFTLTLNVDEEHYYEEDFGPVPYTNEGVVFLFKGDHFGVKLDAQGVPTYEPDLEKADLEFQFSQDELADHKPMMMLVITNHLDRTVSMNAIMTVPTQKEILKTTIVPIQKGLKSFESWPHPIVQLALKGFRLEP